ncbi:MAG: four helix bundle protein [Methanobacteriota archaeon]|nr:MAG: four helix bundle protein [Euryarchaeota archaeon]
MRKVKLFEELRYCQKGQEVMNLIYSATDSEALLRDFELRNHFWSAATANMSNIARRILQKHPKIFIRYLNISQSSIAEVRSLINVDLEQKYLSEKQFRNMQNTDDECRHLALGLLRYLTRFLSQPTATAYELIVDHTTAEPSHWPVWYLSEKFTPSTPTDEHFNIYYEAILSKTNELKINRLRI